MRCLFFNINIAYWACKRLRKQEGAPKLTNSTPLRVGCSKFRYKSDIKSARIQLVKLLTFNTLHCEIIL